MWILLTLAAAAPTRTKVAANGLVFNCFEASPGPDADKVVLLHGFPEWAEMYGNLQDALLAAGLASLACDQRGYSDTAAPDGEAKYDYTILASDVFAVADAHWGPGVRFHLVGHDHGAVLGWTIAAKDSQGAAQRVKTYSALSIPHVDAFSAGLFGPGADLDQQMASQYFSMFVLPDSASLHASFWYISLGLTCGGEGFQSPQAFQKALWWYNGAAHAGVMAFPPMFDSSFLWDKGQYAMSGLRKLFGMAVPAGWSADGQAASHPSGLVHIPTLYVCGKTDSSILCNHDYALKTKDYVAEDQPYEYLEVACGHDVLDCATFGLGDGQKVIDAVVRLVTAHPGGAAALERAAPQRAPAPGERWV